MKKIIIILFIFSHYLSIAQISQSVDRANMYFERAFYNDAIPIYENIYKKKKNFNVSKKLADCHFYVNNMQRASKVYKYLIDNYSHKIDEQYYFKYANTLKASNNYKEAFSVMKNYFIKTNDTVRLKKLQESEKYLENVAAIGERFTINNLAINTKNSDFGAFKHGNTLIFATSRKENSLLDKKYKWNGQHYLDLYQIELNKELSNTNVTSFSSTINTKLHEATIALTKDGKTVYFTRNNYQKGKRKRDTKKVTHLQIFKAELVDGKWQNITLLPFNNKAYSTEHPALSLDEKTLYFASDMPGGFGSFDIYSVEIFDDGSYGKPVNLGATINTNRKEQFPFVSNDNAFYFSSDGHPGFGSLDVFVSSITKDNKFSKPDNIGFPVNSGYDDFSFTIDSQTKEGYFASNRTGGKGSDDIYKIAEQKPLIITNCQQSISGIITDVNTKNPLANTVVVLLENDKELQRVNTNEDGKFYFKINCETNYLVKANKEGYTKNQKEIIATKERNKEHDASMQLKSLETLKKEKAQALVIKKEKLAALKQKKAETLALKKEQKLKDIIKNEKDIVKENGQLKIKTKEVNFDYNLWYLRRDTKKAIDRVVNLMKKYPNMVVEVGTHTDIRGNNRYNAKLSQKRATSVKMYLLEKGIEPDRISAIGYGETKPIVKCKTEDSCSEEQHELNRRSEFIIKNIL